MPSGVETLKVTQAMGEHMELLCREARGVAAAATEEGAEEALKQVVQGIREMVATTEKGQQLQEAAAEAAYLRAAVLWHKLHAHADGLMIGDARQVKTQRRAERRRKGKAQQQAALAKKLHRWLDKSKRPEEVLTKVKQTRKAVKNLI